MVFCLPFIISLSPQIGILGKGAQESNAPQQSKGPEIRRTGKGKLHIQNPGGRILGAAAEKLQGDHSRDCIRGEYKGYFNVPLLDFYMHSIQKVFYLML
jgi:hypothetical protein